MGVIVGVIVLLMVLNLRGVKESVTVLMPIFLSFLISHALLLIGGVALHAGDAPRVAADVHRDFTNGLATPGMEGMGALLLRAYSMGAGTYTGIEAVSNSMQILREPRVATGKRTMLYMAVSLSFVAGGILVGYVLFDVHPVEGKTLNAVLLEGIFGSFRPAGMPIGHALVVVSLVGRRGKGKPELNSVLVEIAGRETRVYFIVNELGYSRRFHFWCTESADAEHTYEGILRSSSTSTIV
jgi:amino acid transporter